MAVELKDAKTVLLQVNLGNLQKVQIATHHMVNIDLCQASPIYETTLLADNHKEVIQLFCDISKKLCDALDNRERSIQTEVDRKKVVGGC